MSLCLFKILNESGDRMAQKKKTTIKSQRYGHADKQKQKTRRIVWLSTLVVLFVLCIVVLAIPPKAKVEAFNYEGLPVLGNPDAPVKIIEFGDYKCSACSVFAEHIKPQLERDYINQGKVALYFMNYPFLGPDSDTAALAAQAVYHQNKDAFWSYADAIFRNQGDERTQWATVDFLVELAQKENIDIDYEQLRKDIVERTYQHEVDEHRNKAYELRIGGTPTLFVNGKHFTGNFGEYTELIKLINQELEGD